MHSGNEKVEIQSSRDGDGDGDGDGKVCEVSIDEKAPTPSSHGCIVRFPRLKGIRVAGSINSSSLT